MTDWLPLFFVVLIAICILVAQYPSLTKGKD